MSVQFQIELAGRGATIFPDTSTSQVLSSEFTESGDAADRLPPLSLRSNWRRRCRGDAPSEALDRDRAVASVEGKQKQQLVSGEHR